ncbi:uncharacterized protein AB675_9269 [Cyphellophora attinorum]|uniref:Uncharacterized protein n=1 Tax=Cyphellophora attinorum TaxID=1664694 RepID=A0A0N1HC36_9EURO|nr:uncharacterized protein AB675_9269 [Phialophora attinorum]KPI41766.1 hypothetical protein AB675_9269 [Phialophora attinorum]
MSSKKRAGAPHAHFLGDVFRPEKRQRMADDDEQRVSDDHEHHISDDEGQRVPDNDEQLILDGDGQRISGEEEPRVSDDEGQRVSEDGGQHISDDEGQQVPEDDVSDDDYVIDEFPLGSPDLLARLTWCPARYCGRDDERQQKPCKIRCFYHIAAIYDIVYDPAPVQATENAAEELEEGEIGDDDVATQVGDDEEADPSKDYSEKSDKAVEKAGNGFSAEVFQFLEASGPRVRFKYLSDVSVPVAIGDEPQDIIDYCVEQLGGKRHENNRKLVGEVAPWEHEGAGGKLLRRYCRHTMGRELGWGRDALTLRKARIPRRDDGEHWDVMEVEAEDEGYADGPPEWFAQLQQAASKAQEPEKEKKGSSKDDPIEI